MTDTPTTQAAAVTQPMRRTIMEALADGLRRCPNYEARLYLDLGNTDARRVIDALVDRLSAAPAGVGEVYRHKARGTTYRVVGRARLQDATGHGIKEGASLVVYVGDDGQMWARHPAEFYDGRFEALATPQSPAGGEKVGIYVASRASVPERGAMWRAHRAAGVPIISSWIDEDGEDQTKDNAELWARIEREVTSADRLVLYVEPSDFPLKGALVEIGMAIAAGVPVFVVAPGIELHAHTMRPLGSWAKHPDVTFCATVNRAFAAPAALRAASPAGESALREAEGALKVGDWADYTFFDPPLRVQIVANCEGWWEVRCSDDSVCLVRPSRLRAALGSAK